MRPFLALLALALASCGYESIEEATCPPQGTELTYEAFGRPFFLTYCNTCHSAGNSGRQGAPDNYVFDTREQILEHRSRIFERSAGSNDSMPPGPDDPPLDKRDKLAEWLVCGAP